MDTGLPVTWITNHLLAEASALKHSVMYENGCTRLLKTDRRFNFITKLHTLFKSEGVHCLSVIDFLF